MDRRWQRSTCWSREAGRSSGGGGFPLRETEDRTDPLGLFLMPLVEARSLTKKFGDLTAVGAIDFAVAPGESFGFLGPNGAGKTSAMRMIGALSPVTEGDLQVLGMDPAADG